MALEVYDEIGAPDDADYYGGKKWPWLMSLGPVRRALSDHKGNYEVGRFTVSWADPERRIRQLLASGPGKYTPGKTVAAYLVSEAGRRAKVTPRLMAWGVVEGGPKYGANLTIDLTCRDVVGGSNKNWGMDGEALIPKRVIAAPEFPEARTEVREMGVPFPLGVLSSALPSVGAAPVITGNVDKDRGYDTSTGSSGGVNGDWCGFGDTNGPAPPTNLQWDEVLDAGAEMGTDAHSAFRYYILVTSVDANGVEGDSEPFYTGIEATLNASTSALHVSWTASAEAAKYRCYLGWAWYGSKFQQYLETTNTECTFTRSPVWVPEIIITEDMITPGAHFPSGGIWAGWYRVSAVMTGGVETELSDGRISGGETEGRWGVSHPYRRPIRLEWEAVTGATAYRVYRSGIWGPYNMAFDVPSTQCYYDDWNVGGTEVVPPEPPHGAFQPIYVGDVTVEGQTWRELLVAGCAIKDITHWYYTYDDEGETVIETDQGDGTDFLIPFTASWAARYPNDYLDVAGSDGITRRRTVIYARGPKGDAIADGTATFRIDLEGVEDTGNGTGDTLTDLYDQSIWFFEQLVLQDYQTGDWTCPPKFPDTDICQINRPSFRALTAQRNAEITGGYQAAWVVGASGERQSVSSWIKRICQSGQFRVGPNRFWQIRAWALNSNLSVANLPHIKDAECVDKGDGDPIPHFDHLANVIEYTYGPPFDEDADWLGTATVKDSTSITAYGQEYPGDQLQLYCLRIPAVAAHAAGQALLYSRLIPHTIEPVGDLRFTNFDLGDAFLYDHYRGLGADGYADRPFVVIGHTFVSQGRQIQLECLDLGEILA